MRASAQARSLRLRSAPPLPRSKACSSRPAGDRGAASGAARARASASPPSHKAAPCSTAVLRQGALPQLVSRLPFPADWRVLLIFDADASGLAGASETAAFEHAAGLSGERDRRALPADRARRAAGPGRGRLQDLLRAGRLFAGVHGRLFRAVARRALYQPARQPGARMAPQPRRHRARPELLGADRLCLRRVGGGGRGSARPRCGPTSSIRASASTLAQGRNEGAKIETGAERNPVSRAH